MQKFLNDNPEARSKQQKKRCENPEEIKKMSERVKKHHQENPNMRYEILDKKGLNKPFDVFTNDGTFIVL